MTCPDCQGDGDVLVHVEPSTNYADYEECERCGGAGYVNDDMERWAAEVDSGIAADRDRGWYDRAES